MRKCALEMGIGRVRRGLQDRVGVEVWVEDGEGDGITRKARVAVSIYESREGGGGGLPQPSEKVSADIPWSGITHSVSKIHQDPAHLKHTCKENMERNISYSDQRLLDY